MLVDDAALTDTQAECIKHGGEQLVVRGVAGSGKTVVLLKRALWLRNAQPGRVVVFTYGRTLSRYARELLERLSTDGVEALTFHQWAFSVLSSFWRVTDRRRTVRIVDEDERLNLIERAVAQERDVEPRRRSAVLARPVAPFWSQELSWIRGCGFTELNDYLAADRIGRGSALAQKPREIVWKVLQRYDQELGACEKIDWEKLACILKGRVDRNDLTSDFFVDHVLIDEAQDLTRVELQVLRAAARKTFTLAADHGQKIYRSTFSWKDVGIDLSRGTKLLRQAFRSTKEIVALAASLRDHDRLKERGDTALDYVAPERAGPKPKVHQTSSTEAMWDRAAQLAAECARVMPSDRIGVLARDWTVLRRLLARLRALGARSELIQREDGKLTGAGIYLTTLHTAKGLEFDHVIIAGVEEGLLPQLDDDQMGDALSPEDLEEAIAPERRLLYVSLTRARLTLTLVHGPQPSRFMAEMSPALYDVVHETKDRGAPSGQAHAGVAPGAPLLTPSSPATAATSEERSVPPFAVRDAGLKRPSNIQAGFDALMARGGAPCERCHKSFARQVRFRGLGLEAACSCGAVKGLDVQLLQQLSDVLELTCYHCGQTALESQKPGYGFRLRCRICNSNNHWPDIDRRLRERERISK